MRAVLFKSSLYVASSSFSIHVQKFSTLILFIINFNIILYSSDWILQVQNDPGPSKKTFEGTEEKQTMSFY